MLERMQHLRPSPRVEATDVVSDSTFITNAAQQQTTTTCTTATRDANLTLKLLQMKRDKDREMSERRDAALEAMNESLER